MVDLEHRFVATENLELRQDEDNPSSIRGVVKYDVLSVDMGGWREVIRSNAFKRHVDNTKNEILALNQHDAAQVLGSTFAGTMRVRNEDDGVHFEVDMPDTTYGRDLLVSLGRKDIRGVSFGMYVDKDEFVKKDKQAIREVIEGRLVEISVVTFPAYAKNKVSTRAIKQIESMDTTPLSMLFNQQKQKEAELM